MKPVRLKIKGLNSYIEEQVIDFNRLTERGLFGIFGPTGSGKSTILDAIILALYGEIPRETKEFVNPEADSLYIYYEFSMKYGGERKNYVVERTFKRTEEGIRKSKDARFYLKKDENEIEIIAESINLVTKEIEKTIGLKAADFTRSVVLPQGKFSEFLRLTGAERRSMLERIFGLEKYGRFLGEKIKKTRDKKREELLNIESQLAVYGNITEEDYKALEESLKQQLEEEKQLRKEYDEINKQYEKYQSIWELQKELILYEDKLKELDEKEATYLNIEKCLKRAEDAEKIKPHIDELEKIQAKAEETCKAMDMLKKRYDSLCKQKEETEGKYLEALNEKNIKHSLLLQKQANLDQAILLLEKKRLMESERNQLRQDYLKNSEAIKKEEEKEEKIKEQLLEIEETLKKIEEEKEKIYIEPAFREEIQKAYEIEKEYLSLLTSQKETLEKVQQLAISIEKSKNQLEKWLKEKEEKAKNLTKVNEELKKLKEIPSSQELIFEKHKYIEALKSQEKILTEQLKKKEAEQNRLIEISKALKEKEVQKENLFNEMEKLRKKLDQIKEEIKSLEKTNMAAILASELKEGEACPVCGSTSHHPVHFDFDEEKYHDLLEQEKRYIQQFQEIEEKYHDLVIKLAEIYNEKNQSETELKKTDDCVNEQEINKIKEKLSEEEKNLESLIFQISSIEKALREKEKELSEIKEQLNMIEIEEARIQEGILRDEKQYKDLEQKSKELEEQVRKTTREYNAIKEKLQSDRIEEKIKQIIEWDKKRLSLEEKEKNLREEMKNKEKEKEELAKWISKLNQDNAVIKQSGTEKSAMIKTWEEEIQKLSEGREPYQYKDEISKIIQGLIDKEAQLKEVFEKIKAEEERVKESHIKLKTQWEALNQNQTEKNEKLSVLFQEYHFSNAEDVLKAWLEKDKKKSLEEDLRNYKEMHNEVKNNIIRIRQRIGEDKISQEEWEKLKERKSNKAAELEMKTKRIAVIQEKLNILIKDLEKVAELNRQKAKLDRIFSLLDELTRLVQGYKFVEYIASSQLKYIAKEASKTLKQITMGRYALELDSTGNFVIRDDFNGGIRRSASTLSGGETFLTSLSLALALSSQIQLKNASPLEFFFLDEGFGTLDSHLLDLVMSALERLHSQQLSVGIISHVEELKNRIPVKLIVEPAEQGIRGSRVRIE
ncbi:MAG TPA: AAA family ATPase [Defluviitaleaceae bacterium]|nr:AAA family ATPase [Defluviitaleaceae bacterium]HQD49610.1 AAA family ATPase [Defluviitaleaceae bacterium]